MWYFTSVLFGLFSLPSSALGTKHDVPTRHYNDDATMAEDKAFWNRILYERTASMGNDGSSSSSSNERINSSIEGMVIVPSRNSFGDTWNNLVTALDNAPVRIVAEVPHSDAAASVGLVLDPNWLVVFGNPSLGTPIMQENREARLDLPQKILVWENNEVGQVFVGYNSVEYLEFRHHGIQTASTMRILDTIEGALMNFASAASGVSTEDILRLVDDTIIDNRISRGVITEESDADFETTWDRLNMAIAQSPADILFTVDHNANARSVGLDLLPTRLVVFGNPTLGTPLMQVSPTAGIDLPLNMLVWEDNDGIAYVTTNDVDFQESRHFINAMDEALNRINAAVQNSLTIATTTTR